MKLLFCADPLDSRQPDSLYEAEVAAARALGLDFYLIDFETLVSGSTGRAVRTVPQQDEPTLAVYRGWMLKPFQYAALYDALAERGVQLVNTPAQYQHAHYLPESYPVIERHTPKTVWTTDTDIAAILPLLTTFGDKPLILKDFVKSQKHYWNEACYIPSAADSAAVERVVKRFLELQGDDLNEGLVFREFVPLEPLTQHEKSGMPLTKEFRIFWLDGEPLYSIEYWEQGDYAGLNLPIDSFRAVAQQVQSCFFTMDVAKQLDGEWLIVELGDAQVAGLPEKADVNAFYQALLARLVSR